MAYENKIALAYETLNPALIGGIENETRINCEFLKVIIELFEIL